MAGASMTGRNRERLEAVAEGVRAAGGTPGEPQVADFVSLAEARSPAEVRSLAERLLRAHDRIHVLVNNAGMVSASSVTVDGHGKTSQVNHLAPFLLTGRLLDRLQSSAPARVVTTASSEHLRGGLSIDALDRDERAGGYGGKSSRARASRRNRALGDPPPTLQAAWPTEPDGAVPSAATYSSLGMISPRLYKEVAR